MTYAISTAQLEQFYPYPRVARDRARGRFGQCRSAEKKRVGIPPTGVTNAIAPACRLRIRHAMSSLLGRALTADEQATETLIRTVLETQEKRTVSASIRGIAGSRPMLFVARPSSMSIPKARA